MIIREILTLKGDAEIYSIAPEQSVADAVRLMVQHDVGSLVVRGKDRMVGLVTERDVLRALNEKGCDVSRVKVSELMTTEPIIGNPEDTVDYLRGVMTEHRISHLPVVEGESLLGVISFHDVAKACVKEASFENRLLKRYIKNWPE
jgi:CBS domain-containing protein